MVHRDAGLRLSRLVRLGLAAVWVAGKVFPGVNLVGRAFVGALIPMLMDVWIDPVFTHRNT